MDSTKINVAIVHGIGINTNGYAQPLIHGVRTRFQFTLQRLLNKTENFAQELNFVPIVWDDIVGPKEAKMVDIFRLEFQKRRKKSVLEIVGVISVLLVMAGILNIIFHQFWFFVILLGALVWYVPQGIYQLRTTFAGEFVADITSYNEKSAKEQILQRIEDRLRQSLAIEGKNNLSVVSHSLGTVIASDFVWERKKAGQLLDQGLTLHNFFTMGSPLPIFSLQFGGPETFNKPISMSAPEGRWVNIYDNDDPIAYPLKLLNDAYAQAVLRDQEVNVGLFGVAHVQYWANARVHAIIADKLALDWLKLNGKMSESELTRYYAQYDQAVELKSVGSLS